MFRSYFYQSIATSLRLVYFLHASMNIVYEAYIATRFNLKNTLTGYLNQFQIRIHKFSIFYDVAYSQWYTEKII